MFKRIRQYFALSSCRKKILNEAMLFLFLAKMLLFVLPVKKVISISMVLRRKREVADLLLLKNLKWSLFHANRISIWKNKCLVQSIAGKWMLQRRNMPLCLYFGASHDDSGKLIAHAWLDSNGFEIVEKGHDHVILKEICS